jgi:hypothetical protein
MLALSDRLYSLASTFTHENIMSELSALIVGMAMAAVTTLTSSAIAQT